MLVHSDTATSAQLIRRLRANPTLSLTCERVTLLSEALRNLRATKVDLILAEHSLLAADDYAFFERLQENPEGPGVIVLDHNQDPERNMAVLGFGALDYLPLQGLTDGALYRSVQHAFHRHQTSLRLHQELLVKNRFITIISHDIRSPLVILAETLGYLCKRLDSMNPAQLRNFLEKAERRSQSLVEMTENLLTWSSLQSGKMKPDMERINLHVIAAKAIESARSQAESKGVELCNEVPAGTWLESDQNMIACVLRNLLTNAIKFSFQGQRVFVRCHTTEGEVRISVKDHGIGIQPEDRDKLFQADQLFSRRGTGSEEGNGMGLLLCHEFIKTLGGSIDVDSEPASGASFTVILPR
ncbi:MAG: hybrid sensor histidine kinase/response regulator [Verrucomicrobia bacterium]|nr:hybrid sensor histidine kinase/response regulator [Verrucomicrobiota bacterium]